jgi:hypothetical protein
VPVDGRAGAGAVDEGAVVAAPILSGACAREPLAPAGTRVLDGDCYGRRTAASTIGSFTIWRRLAWAD